MEPSAHVDLLDSSSSSSELSSALSSPSPPSSPLSILSHSPSPPPALPRARAYPSPPASQQTSNYGSPTPDGSDLARHADEDIMPPAKRRRVSKERITETLNLRCGDVKPEDQPPLDRLLSVLHKRRKIVVIAGAGISVAAGIPDFRSSTGLFTSLKSEHKLKGSGKDLFDASVYKDDSSTSSFHTMVSSMSRMTKDAKATAFHHMLATLAKEDRLLRLYSQNVDGIETALEPLRTSVPLRKDENGKWPKTVQLHGGLDKMVCSKCHLLSDFDADLFDGPTAPPCSACEEINDIRTNMEGKRSHGIGRLRPRMVLYNEHNPDDEAIGAVTREDLRRRPDAVIVVGTTLKVPGVRRIVREMCGVVRDRRDGVAVWINNDPPPSGPQFEDCWDIVVSGPADEVATRAAMRPWDAPVRDSEVCPLTEEQLFLSTQKTVSVVVPQTVMPPRSIPEHLLHEPLPSDQHVNHSFKLPDPLATPKRPMPHGPADYSPMSSRVTSVITSIEQTADADSVTVVTGLLTPTKSSNASSPPKSLPTFAEKLKDAGAATAKQNLSELGKPKAPPKKKQTNVKYIKPTLAKTKTKTRPSAKKASMPRHPTEGLTSLFKTSKTTGIQVGNQKKLLAQPDQNSPMTPSKLRQVSSANSSSNSEPMHPLAPQDPRSNTSPSKPRPYFPGFDAALENSTLKEKMEVKEAVL